MVLHSSLGQVRRLLLLLLLQQLLPLLLPLCVLRRLLLRLRLHLPLLLVVMLLLLMHTGLLLLSLRQSLRALTRSRPRRLRASRRCRHVSDMVLMHFSCGGLEMGWGVRDASKSRASKERVRRTASRGTESAGTCAPAK